MKKFVLIGDWGQEEGDGIPFFSSKWVERLHASDYDELLLLGDNFYPNGVKNVHDSQWDAKMKRFFPKHKVKNAILGNHDYVGDVHAQLQYSLQSKNFNWNLPHFFYDHYYESVGCHIFFIDTQILSPMYTTAMLVACNASQDRLQTLYRLHDKLEKSQLRWLDAGLQHSKAKWKIVVGHYPVISSGLHEISGEIQEKLAPLFEKHKVDIYASGHDHNLQLNKKENTYFVVTGALSYFTIPPATKNTLYIGKERGCFSIEVTENEIKFLVWTESKEYCVYHLIKN